MLLPYLLALTAPLAPHQDEAITRIAFASCIRQDRPAPALDAVLAQDPEVFVFLGDNIYGDSDDPEVLAEKWATLNSMPAIQRLFATATVLGTWDDHDFGRNDSGAEYPARAASQDLFLDFLRVAQDDPRREQRGVHHALTLGPPGRRVQFLVLDTRYHRSPLDRVSPRPPGRGPYVPTDDTSRTLLGEEQWRWLEARLREPAELRVIASSIQLVADEHGWECWANLPHERERLLRLIAETDAGGVLVLSGDRHAAEISRLAPPRDGRGAGYPIVDVTASSINQGRGWFAERNRHRVGDLWSGDNFGTLTVRWDGAPRVEVAIHDGGGEVRLLHTVSLSELQPAPEPEVLVPERIERIAFGSCNDQREPTPLWDPLLAADPDLFLFLGDNVYGDTEDMDVLQAAYAALAAQPGFARLREAVPILATWDDHDFGSNDAGKEWAHKAESKAVQFEFFDVPPDSPRRAREGIHGSWCFGPPEERVQVILLDLRTHRDPWGKQQVAPRDGDGRPGDYAPNTDPAATILGDEQWAWLQERLRVPAAVRLIGSSLQCLPQGHVWECWDMMPRERERLLRTIRDSAANGVVVVSGDTHWAELSRVDPCDSGVPYPLWEMTSSGMNQGWRFTNIDNRHRVDLPIWEANWGLVSFDWEERTLTLEARAAGGRGLRQVISIDDLRAPEQRR